MIKDETSTGPAVVGRIGASDYQRQDRIRTYSGSSSNNASSDVGDLAHPSSIEWLSEDERSTVFESVRFISVFDVAAYILKKLGQMTTMKLQKLVYYCQAWSLVWDENPLFSEAIEAWANGPVVRELFAYHRGHFRLSSIDIGNPDLLDKEQQETIDAVTDFYGDHTSQQLIDLAHMEDPWKKTRGSMPDMERGSKVIGLDLMADYYSSLPAED